MAGSLTSNITSKLSLLKPVQIILLLALLQLLVALLTNGFTLSSDEAMWHYIGRNWFRNGLVPYNGGVDNKSPIFYAVFGLSDWLFGVNYWFPRLLGVICQSIGIFYVYKIAVKLAGDRAGVLAISFYGLSIMWHCADGRYASYDETYAMLFMILAANFFVGATTTKGIFLSGLFAAIAIGLRLSAGFGVAALLFTLIYQDRKNALVFCCGVLAGIFFLTGTYVMLGINPHSVYVYTIVDNYGSGSTTDHSFLWRLEQGANMFFYSELVLFYPLIIGYLIIKKNVDWLVLWLMFCFIGINIIGNYARVQLKCMLPAFSLISAIAVAHIVDAFPVSIKQVTMVIWVCFFPKLIEPFVNFKKVFVGNNINMADYSRAPFAQPDEYVWKKLGLWIKANTTVNNKVFVAGYGATAQVYSERVSPSIYFNATQTTLAKQRFYQDMQANKPEMILVPLFPQYKQYIGADLRNYVDQLVLANYHLERCLYSYNIYRRN